MNNTPDNIPDGLPDRNEDRGFDLSEGQRRRIEAGRADVKAGRVMTSEEFWKRLKADDELKR